MPIVIVEINTYMQTHHQYNSFVNKLTYVTVYVKTNYASRFLKLLFQGYGIHITVLTFTANLKSIARPAAEILCRTYKSSI